MSDAKRADSQNIEAEIRHDLEHGQLDAIISSMGDGLIVVDKNFKILAVNHATEKILEIKSDELIGKTPFEEWALLKAGKELKEKERPLLKAVSEGRITIAKTEDDFFLQTLKGKKIPVSFTITPLILDAAITGAVIVFRDITEEKTLEDAKDSFISIASHQLRTPITAIRWYTEILQSDDSGSLNKNQKTFLEQIYKGVLKLIDTLNIFLALARIESGRVKIEPVKTDLIDFTNDIIKELEPIRAEKKLKIDLAAKKDDLSDLPMDQVILRQVILNLLSNAIRYSNEGGLIDVNIESRESEIIWSIRDNGIGIPENQQNRIFEKFFRTDNAVEKVPEGNGLGLALVKDLVELWRGKIWFESVQNKGATFYFTIPLAGMKPGGGDKSLAV